MPIYLRDVLENPELLTGGKNPPTNMSGDGPDHPMDPELDDYYEEVGKRLEAEMACKACGTKMVLVEYERPGGPPGNSLRCFKCHPKK